MMVRIANKYGFIPGTSLAVVWRRVGDLINGPKDSRPYSREQIVQLAKGITIFGLRIPILIGQGSGIIAGYGKLLAARELGWSEVPTIRLDQLSPDQAHVFRLADDRCAETASWDELLLAMRLKELSSADTRLDEAHRGSPEQRLRLCRTRPQSRRSRTVGRPRLDALAST
jgi:ParB-like chromosome segregation protein Spo0J